MRKKVRKDQKNAGESEKLKYPLKIGCFCSIFPFRTGQRANSTETADGQSNWRNQSKQKAPAHRRTWPTTAQRHELSPHSNRWLPQASRECATVWIEFQTRGKKRAKKHTRTWVHIRAPSPTQARKQNDIDTVNSQLHCGIRVLTS